MTHVFDRSTAELSSWIRTEIRYTAPVSVGAVGKPVRRAQEWLTLHGHGLVVDGDFGPATARAVRAFQSAKGLNVSSVVDEPTFGRLVAPMVEVLRQRLRASVSPGDAVVAYARAHLAQHPREVGGPNSGPWVRLYMSGQQGAPFAWCAGFVTFLLEQAAQSLSIGKPIAGSVSCDALAAQAERAGIRISEDEAPAKLTAGSIFLVRRIVGDWTHTGIVTEVHDDTFETIEGNTNDSGSREGIEVCARTRSYAGKDFILI
jgi:peptidoglycan hydrolase-like protein with peptidoglycan-binding domain